jgi:glycosyltransferase involved in cell wall biosynthesis
MKKVSIIIPIYNLKEYLCECLDSVIGQTLKDIEIICVNDGSTDGSQDILNSYRKKDERIVIIEQNNSGYGQSMNKGIEQARGEYIGIVEADDYVPLNMYEELYKKAVENELDFVKADFYRFKRSDSGSMELNYNHLSQHKKDYNIVFNPSENPEAIRFIMNTWSGIYKRSFLEENNIRHNETPGASFQDNGFWFQTFVFAKRAMIIDKPYYMNRRDNPNSSVYSEKKVYCMNREYDFIRSILVKDKEIWERFKYIYWLKKYNNYMGTLWRIAEEYRHDYLLRICEELRRAESRGELKKEVFTKAARNNIKSMTEDPEKYYLTRVYPQTINQKVFEKMTELETENRKLKEEIKELRQSESFRIGKKITFIPGAIKRWRKRK